MPYILSFLPSGEDKGPPPRSTGLGEDVEEGTGKRPQVLIVEDEYLVAMEAEAALIDAGFDVVGVAHSAEEAVTLARSAKPHLIVMDIRLASTRDGVDAAREIFEATGIRCLFVTAHQTPDVRARAQSASPLGWLPKPYTPDALVCAVQGALARQDLEN